MKQFLIIVFTLNLSIFGQDHQEYSYFAIESSRGNDSGQNILENAVKVSDEDWDALSFEENVQRYTDETARISIALRVHPDGKVFLEYAAQLRTRLADSAMGGMSYDLFNAKTGERQPFTLRNEFGEIIHERSSHTIILNNCLKNEAYVYGCMNDYYISHVLGDHLSSEEANSIACGYFITGKIMLHDNTSNLEANDPIRGKIEVRRMPKMQDFPELQQTIYYSWHYNQDRARIRNPLILVNTESVHEPTIHLNARRLSSIHVDEVDNVTKVDGPDQAYPEPNSEGDRSSSICEPTPEFDLNSIRQWMNQDKESLRANSYHHIKQKN